MKDVKSTASVTLSCYGEKAKNKSTAQFVLNPSFVGTFKPKEPPSEMKVPQEKYAGARKILGGEDNTEAFGGDGIPTDGISNTLKKRTAFLRMVTHILNFRQVTQLSQFFTFNSSRNVESGELDINGNGLWTTPAIGEAIHMSEGGRGRRLVPNGDVIHTEEGVSMARRLLKFYSIDIICLALGIFLFFFGLYHLVLIFYHYSYTTEF
ncbi:uncharacterized protein LOC106663392 [Cimex lectularius]|uniref:Uncharacterized protein n=1 Tax=Cimex lectularius TaxID=79782 RepID=A0A8I6REC6_CIMLE|nr:uncharacterized protein LOC106663392 [Cimex lectularius]